MRYTRQTRPLCAAASAFLVLVLAACSVADGVRTEPSISSALIGNTGQTGHAGHVGHGTNQATATPSPDPIQTDDNPSTAGVFLGEVCPGGAAVTCSDFASTFRKTPALSTTFTDWDMELGEYLELVGAAAMQAQGTAQEITWQPQTLTGSVTFDAINAGDWDAYFKTQALALKAYGEPVFLRPFHEFNGNWYPWSLVNQGASSATDTAFISAWQRMVRIFRRAGATNVRFIWCFATATVPPARLNPWNAPIAAYPGDDYVDWIGFDAYNRANDTDPNRWHTFSQTIGASYLEALTISAVRPIIVSETASNEYGDGGAMKAEWIGELTSELSTPTANDAFPHVRAVSYFDINLGTYDYSLESSVPAETAWIAGVRTLNASGLPNFRGNGNVLGKIRTWSD